MVSNMKDECHLSMTQPFYQNTVIRRFCYSSLLLYYFLVI